MIQFIQRRLENEHIRHIFFYGIIGVVALIIQDACYLFFMKTKILYPSVAMMVGSIVAMIFAYFGHNKITFQKDRLSKMEFTKYFLTSFVGLCINVGGVRLITKVLHLDPHFALIPTFITPVITFLISKFWTFK